MVEKVRQSPLKTWQLNSKRDRRLRREARNRGLTRQRFMNGRPAESAGGLSYAERRRILPELPRPNPKASVGRYRNTRVAAALGGKIKLR